MKHKKAREDFRKMLEVGLSAFSYLYNILHVTSLIVHFIANTYNYFPGVHGVDFIH